VNPLHAFARRYGATPWFLALAKRIVVLDGAIQRRTRARYGLLPLVGLTGLLLTTTGSRTGLPRTVSLLYVAAPEGYVVAASNFGGPRHPDWSVNLLADPSATVTVAGRSERVTARLAAGTQRDRLWSLLVAAWPGYLGYAERAGRDIRVFLLVPAVAS
jgi:deazaflavin-dependent oxidoreductase (nitroreductase family)